MVRAGGDDQMKMMSKSLYTASGASDINLGAGCPAMGQAVWAPDKASTTKRCECPIVRVQEDA